MDDWTTMRYLNNAWKFGDCQKSCDSTRVWVINSLPNKGVYEQIKFVLLQLLFVAYFLHDLLSSALCFKVIKIVNKKIIRVLVVTHALEIFLLNHRVPPWAESTKDFKVSLHIRKQNIENLLHYSLSTTYEASLRTLFDINGWLTEVL